MKYRVQLRRVVRMVLLLLAPLPLAYSMDFTFQQKLSPGQTIYALTLIVCYVGYVHFWFMHRWAETRPTWIWVYETLMKIRVADAANEPVDLEEILEGAPASLRQEAEARAASEQLASSQ